MRTDAISEMITVIRNGLNAKKDVVTVYHSGLKESLLKVLRDEGYILSYDVVEIVKGSKKISICLKYEGGRSSVISELKRVSKPSRRIYKRYDDLLSMMGGVGLVIVSTSKGLMSLRGCKELKIGGEVVCSLW